jgi:predicted Zn finger-like uncharacterized protein
MILTCPNCGTQYVVKDGAIPAQGRQVRCASCKHSWHQDPEAAPFEADQETLSEATMIDPSGGPEAEERAYEEAVIEEAAAEEAQPIAQPMVEPVEAVSAGLEEAAADERVATDIQEYDAPPEAEPQTDDDFSPFAERDYVEPRRRSPLLALFLVLVVVAALAAAFWFLAPPEWKARLGIAEAGATPLQLTLTHSDRQPLVSGGESLTVTGRVINPTSKSHSVPPIYAQLKTRSGQVIYAWTIQPPAPTLKPGGSASFNSTEVGVPPGGDDLTISLGTPKA